MDVKVSLYKNMVRPHVEYAIPVWAAISETDLGKLEKVQEQCLKNIIGAKCYSSTSVVEVITRIMHVRIRIRELCCREYLRIKRKDDQHILRQMLDQTSRAGLRFCPLSYITVMSRRFERTLVGCTLVSESKESRGTLDIRIITITTTRDKVEVDRCLERHWGNAVQMFTDGSV